MILIDTHQPHYKVYTRLKPSKIHGIGIFAIIPIPKGTYIFYGDEETKLINVPTSTTKSLPKEIQKLYEDFCILKEPNYICPENFNNITISWYLNTSKTPNIGCDSEYNFYTLRDVEPGEELLVDYDTYSE